LLLLLLLVLLLQLLLLLLLLLPPLLLLLMLRQVVVQWGLDVGLCAALPGLNLPSLAVPTGMDSPSIAWLEPPEPRLAPSEGEIVAQRSVDEIVQGLAPLETVGEIVVQRSVGEICVLPSVGEVPRLATPTSPRGQEPAAQVSCGGGGRLVFPETGVRSKLGDLNFGTNSL
jgi:hypothetical protein